MDMTEAQKKAKELAYKFSTLEDAVKCVEEILKCTFSQLFYIDILNDIVDNKNTNEFWQEVLTELKNM